MTTKTAQKTNIIRDQITAYLATVDEATAKTVASKIGKSESLSSVINELNAMRTEALVEGEKKKGKGNEYWYWLVAKPTTGDDTRELEDRIRRLEGERDTLVQEIQRQAERLTGYDHAVGVIHQICRDAGIDAGLVHERVKALAVMAKTDAEHVARYQSLAETATAEMAKLAAERNELQRGFAEATSELGVRAHTIANLEGAIGLYKEVAQSDAQRIQALQAELATERQANAALKEQLDTLPDIKRVGCGFLVRAPKKAPRIVTKPEAAQAAALAAARNGSGRGDVYALVHVGRAVRGAEWKAAKQ